MVSRSAPRRKRAPAVADALLAWYDAHRRDLPWRAAPGVRADAYAVWLSEIMLQQTTVAAVAPYYRAFLARWPTVEALAAAPLDDVIAAWAGLGYYARARNLHACAKAVTGEHGGRFPHNYDALLGLPGVGAYTAAAVAAIAFDEPRLAQDGNVDRVVARLFAIETPLPAARREIAAKGAPLVPRQRAGDFAQALMDLGATICTPRAPSCPQCPLASRCEARAQGKNETLPLRASKPAKPARRGAVFVLHCGKFVMLRRRPASGLLGGTSEFPSTPLTQDIALDEAPSHAPCPANWRLIDGTVRHVFTHFSLELSVFVAATRSLAAPQENCRWAATADLSKQGLPTLMRKVAALAGLHDNKTMRRWEE